MSNRAPRKLRSHEGVSSTFCWFPGDWRIRKTRRGISRRERSGYVAARVVSGLWTSWTGTMSERDPESRSGDAVGGGFRRFSGQQNRRKSRISGFFRLRTTEKELLKKVIFDWKNQ